MDLSKLIVLAAISEALWETSKLIWDEKDKKVIVDRAGAAAIGILVAIATGLDLFKLSGMPISIPILGQVLTGLLLSRGANFVHDIAGSMNIVYTDIKDKSRSSASGK